MDWTSYYPAFATDHQVSEKQQTPMTTDQQNKRIMKDVTVADIGCGFGGLLVSLGPKLPDDLLVGLRAFSSI